MKTTALALFSFSMMVSGCAAPSVNDENTRPPGPPANEEEIQDTGDGTSIDEEDTASTDTDDTDEDDNSQDDTDGPDNGNDDGPDDTDAGNDDTDDTDDTDEDTDSGSGSSTTVVVEATGLPTALPPSGTSGTLTTSLTASAGTIEDLNVAIDIDHSCSKDLSAILLSPSGTSVVLFDLSSLPVCSSDIEDTYLDDEASITIASGSTPFTGSHQPTGSLSRFDGEDADGVWTLTITDDTAGDKGKLYSWSLEFLLN